MGSLPGFTVDIPGLAVRPRPELKAGALRYFDAAQAPPPGIAEILGGALPAPLQAVARSVGGGRLTLAWRTPTETLALSPNAVILESLAQVMTSAGTWGCWVDQTGGLTVWEVTGRRTRELLERIGSAASMPPVGEARTSRMADLPVLALRTDEATTVLVVDQLYAEHLAGWVEEISADF